MGDMVGSRFTGLEDMTGWCFGSSADCITEAERNKAYKSFRIQRYAVYEKRMGRTVSSSEL